MGEFKDADKSANYKASALKKSNTKGGKTNEKSKRFYTD